ncbi:MAG: hypothetical protein ACOYMW_01910 [Candidatus Competibacteraceae bacterium]
MSYSDFDLKKVRSAFNLDIIESENLFSNIGAVEVSAFLSEILKQNVPLALAIGTEKASSELIIINIFLELKRQLNISFFSGIEFNVDKDKGLNGYCDFILSKSPEQFFLDVPVIAVVEAKNERITSGLGQCIAEMVAAVIYNEREGKALSCIYGAVTTGHVWKFLKLRDRMIYIDTSDYYINNPEKILGVLTYMINVL